MLVAVLGIAGVGYWLMSRPETRSVDLPAAPLNIDEAFARREAIVAEMISDPRTWPTHLDIAAGLLEQERRMFQADRLWDLDEIYVDGRQLVFRFIARQPLTLAAMPIWREDNAAPSIGALFTNAAFRWICLRPESAAIWDVHTRVFADDETVVMRILVIRKNGDVLRELPVELLPCADRGAVSDG